MRPRGGVLAQRRADVAALPQVEAVERLVGQQDGCGVSRPIASSARLRWPFDSVPIRASSSGSISQPLDHVVRPQVAVAAEEAEREVERPATVCAGHGAIASGR